MIVPHKKTVIIICGPTAVGKTAVAIQIAKHFGIEIISADSRQCFMELNIGVARPSNEELQSVPHHFIASHSIQEDVTAATFEQYALEKLEILFNKKDIVVIVGGTGLYIKAFEVGLDMIPEINPAIRNEIISNYEKNGISWLQKEIKEKDPKFYNEGESQNPQRMMRALEVVIGTGKSVFSFRKGEKVVRGFNILKIGLEVPKEILKERINLRVDKMMQQGLLEEVKSLVKYKQLNALQTVGYSELFEYLDGKINESTAVELIKTHTRQYAKRQTTWFKRDKSISWFQPDELGEMISFLEKHLPD